MVYIYVLKLETNKYYVGKTNNPNFRLEQHFNSSGSTWTKMYKPLFVDVVYPDCDSFDEDKYTKMYMVKYGIGNVRGGTYSQVTLDDQTIDMLTKELRGSTDCCFNCGSADHFIVNCPNKSKVKINIKDVKDVKDVKDIKDIKDVKDVKNINKKNKIIGADICHRCGRKGHITSQCYAKTHIDGHSLNHTSEITLTDTKVVCYRCGREGHISPQCYAKTYMDKYSSNKSDNKKKEDKDDNINCTIS